MPLEDWQIAFAVVVVVTLVLYCRCRSRASGSGEGMLVVRRPRPDRQHGAGGERPGVASSQRADTATPAVHAYGTAAQGTEGATTNVYYIPTTSAHGNFIYPHTHHSHHLHQMPPPPPLDHPVTYPDPGTNNRVHVLTIPTAPPDYADKPPSYEEAINM